MTTTTNNISPLVRALRAKFSSRSKLCEALGVDEALLAEEVARSRKQLGHGPQLGLDARGNRLRLARDQENAGGSPAGNAQARLELEGLLNDYEDGDLPEGFAERHLKALRKHLPLDADAGDEEPQPIARNGELDLDRLRAAIARAEAEGDAGLAERLTKMLHGEGQGARTEMPAALDNGLLDKYLRGGCDGSVIGKALDMLPMNAIKSGLPGGRFAERREHAAGAMDALVTKFPGIEKVEVMTAADRAIDRRREPAAPSATRLERMDNKYGTGRIGIYGDAGATSW